MPPSIASFYVYKQIYCVTMAQTMKVGGYVSIILKWWAELKLPPPPSFSDAIATAQNLVTGSTSGLNLFQINKLITQFAYF